MSKPRNKKKLPPIKRLNFKEALVARHFDGSFTKEQFSQLPVFEMKGQDYYGNVPDDEKSWKMQAGWDALPFDAFLFVILDADADSDWHNDCDTCLLWNRKADGMATVDIFIKYDEVIQRVMIINIMSIADGKADLVITIPEGRPKDPGDRKMAETFLCHSLLVFEKLQARKISSTQLDAVEPSALVRRLTKNATRFSVIQLALGAPEDGDVFYSVGGGSPKCRHGVRGHWAHYRINPFCPHHWQDIPDSEKPRQLCSLCNGRRTFRPAHKRGNDDLGHTIQTYKVKT